MMYFSRRGPPIGSRTPPTTSSSGGGGPGLDSTQPSIQKIRRPTLRPPSRDCILDREHDADPDHAYLVPARSAFPSSCRPRWPHDLAKLLNLGIVRSDDFDRWTGKPFRAN